MAYFDHVVKNQPAVRVYARHNIRGCGQRGDNDRHLVRQHHFRILLQTLVRFVHDKIHGKGRNFLRGILLLINSQFSFDARQPLVQIFLRTRVQRGERTNHPRFALLDNQLRAGHDKHRCSHHWQTQTFTQNTGKIHQCSFAIFENRRRGATIRARLYHASAHFARAPIAGC